MVEPALAGVGILAASVLVAVLLGLLLGRGVERLFRRGRRDNPPDESEPETEVDQPDASNAETDETPAEAHGT